MKTLRLKLLCFVALLLGASVALGQQPGQQVINIGTGPNLNNGDPFRTWATKDNVNFGQLFNSWSINGLMVGSGSVTTPPRAATWQDVIILFGCPANNASYYPNADGGCTQAGGGGATPAGPNFSFQLNNGAGGLAGVIPGFPGTFCPNWASLSVAPTFVICPSATGVTSVGLSLPTSLFTVTVSPVTSTGLLTAVLANQAANCGFFGPASGSAAAPTCRGLVAADLPNIFTAPLATALAAAGTECSAGQAPRGVDASGNAINCFTPSGSGGSITNCASGTNQPAMYLTSGTTLTCITLAAFIGDVNAQPADAQVGTSYTLFTNAADVNGTVTQTNSSASAYILPANATIATAVGTTVNVWQTGTGPLTMTPASGVTVCTPLPTGCTTGSATTYSTSSLNDNFSLFQASANTWWMTTLPGQVTKTSGLMPRVQSASTSSSTQTLTPTVGVADVVSDVDTGSSGTITIANPTGTVLDFQSLILRINSINAQALSWGTAYEGSSAVPLPTTTTGSGDDDYIGCRYQATKTKWQCVAGSAGFP